MLMSSGLLLHEYEEEPPLILILSCRRPTQYTSGLSFDYVAGYYEFRDGDGTIPKVLLGLNPSSSKHDTMTVRLSLPPTHAHSLTCSLPPHSSQPDGAQGAQAH
jgi:hypothetical protein